MIPANFFHQVLRPRVIPNIYDWIISQSDHFNLPSSHEKHLLSNCSIVQCWHTAGSRTSADFLVLYMWCVRVYKLWETKVLSFTSYYFCNFRKKEHWRFHCCFHNFPHTNRWHVMQIQVTWCFVLTLCSSKASFYTSVLDLPLYSNFY